ncbi:glycogen synthase [Aquimarina algiphila]|uniref:glycogen synthase n=1 Tax=Aquimarina algiphila TaxID=2047982 RepID=UPI00249149CA|nr:glycogen/starch synthase [Aquimarina algiphila]
MNILHTSFECYPIAKVGGLADVVGALPKYQNDLGINATVVMPFPDNKLTQEAELKKVHSGTIHLGEEIHQYSIQNIVSPDLGFMVSLLHIPRVLDRANIYGYNDEAERSIAFQLAVLDWVVTTQSIPDIIHCHDHHTALIPFLMSHAEPYEALRRVPSILTIHNAQYQGQLSYDRLEYLPPFDKTQIGLLDWDNCINPLASGIKCAWKVTTVSPNYMKELQKQANGLEALLRSENKKCTGVLNGIDTSTWDPETDPMVVKNYKMTNVVSGRKENKKWICDHFNLDIEKPLFAFIGRLVGEKGADLLPEISKEVLQKNEVNVLILGSGIPEVEEQLQSLCKEFEGTYNTFIGYDEKLSHIIYAGADFLLMPSRVEPCGLNQMYALRYGLIPIVRRTGGLKDTVIDIGDGGFGICHDSALVWDVCYSIQRAVTLYNDQKKYKAIQKKIMKIDHSWDRSANQYKYIYESLIQRK